MFESLLFFSFGYFFARVFQLKPRADILLYWNKDCMGWRPIVNKSEVKPDVRYLAAFEVESSQILEEEVEE